MYCTKGLLYPGVRKSVSLTYSDVHVSYGPYCHVLVYLHGASSVVMLDVGTDDAFVTQINDLLHYRLMTSNDDFAKSYYSLAIKISGSNKYDKIILINHRTILLRPHFNKDHTRALLLYCWLVEINNPKILLFIRKLRKNPGNCE